MNRVLTPEMEQYIKDNYLLISLTEIAKQFGCPKGTVASALRRFGLTVPAELAKERKAAGVKAMYDERHNRPQPGDKILKQDYLSTPVNQLSQKIKRSEVYVWRRLEVLGLEIPDDIIAARKVSTLIKPGTPPPNKGRKQKDYMSPEAIERTKGTRFSKGSVPVNHRPVGSTRMIKDGFLEIKIAEPNKWKLKNRLEWEAINGPIPAGHILVCRTKDKLNTHPDNWELISRSENMNRNTLHQWPSEFKEVIKLKNKLNKIINERGNRKEAAKHAQ